MRRALLLSLLLVGTALAERPEVARVDPPNWFAEMPDPMLLIRGNGLAGAHFTITGGDLRVMRSKSSANGHWAMLFLRTTSAQPGTVRVTVRNAEGSTGFAYTLKRRRAPDAGPRGFGPDDVLYLIMPDRFAVGDTGRAPRTAVNRKQAHAYHGGDLAGVTRHLDYLKDMGVTTVWLTPILENSQSKSDYHGYGATDMYAVEPRFGTMEEYQRLAEELHRRGMKLVFDDVPNHVGQDHPWVTDPPEPDWFHGTAAKHVDNEYHFPPVTDPHAAPSMSRDALNGWFANILPDLNQDNPEVAAYLAENMIWWIETAGLDGLRIDTLPYVPRDFWQRYLGELSVLYPKLTEVGEVEDGDPTIVSYFGGGRTLNGVDTHLTTPFDYPMYYKLLDVLVKGKPMSQLEDTFRQDWLYVKPDLLVPMLGNHDQPRFLSVPGSSPALLRIGFGLLLTMRGTPQMYAGDEILMQGGEDPDNRRDFPGGFAGDPRNAFAASGRTPEQNAMHDWVAGLGKLRAQAPALRHGRQQTVVADDSGFAYVRTESPVGASACTSRVFGSVLVALNRSATPRQITIPVRDSTLAGCRSAQPLLGDGATPGLADPAEALTVSLPAYGFAIYRLK